MVEATRAFNEVNETVQAQERHLRQELQEEALADSLSALQKGEEAKLRFTLIQQVCMGIMARDDGHLSATLMQEKTSLFSNLTTSNRSPWC